MNTPLPLPTRRFHELLSARQGALHSLVCAATQGQTQAEPRGDVVDFKDLAQAESRSAIDAAATQQALRELGEVRVALRRLREGSFGLCLDCGDPIPERRLLALPAAAYCTSCQAVHERARR